MILGPVTMSDCPVKIEDLIAPEVNRLRNAAHILRGDPAFLPVHLSGGIGDVIMAIPALTELAKNGQMLVYTKHLEAFRYFSSIPSLKDLPEFHWHLEFDTVAKFHMRDSFSGFLLDQHREPFLRQQALFKEQPQLQQLVMRDRHQFFLLAHYGKERGWNRREFPMHCLGFDDYKDTPFTRRSKSNRKDIITLHDGYDTQYQLTSRSTKTWNLAHWNELIQQLRKVYPDYALIQLGAKTSRIFQGVHVQKVNQTTLRETFDILKCSSLHIDGDSGLVHAARAMGVRSVVLWGPTPSHFYGYDTNINLRSSVCAEACYGLIQDWNETCVLGYPTPQCMDEILPEQVLDSIKKAL